ncbi:helix-turn-helix domain-containing protein [Thermomonospora echinospora]|uniref:hypothetical protein n=1 Tax=Thermomonospora echinospora TaxID=1992 RepID=UPI00190E9DBC|nr:hypothetical protein [Thermomonospora echinospora]
MTGPVRYKKLCEQRGLGTEPRHVEVVPAKPKRLEDRARLRRNGAGAFITGTLTGRRCQPNPHLRRRSAASRLKKIGSRWRKLPPDKIAVIVRAVLRHAQRLADMAGGNDVSVSTVHRWVREVIDLLAGGRI